MVEIKIKLDEIDYVGIIKAAFPIIKEKAQKETAMWARAVRCIKDPDEKSIEALLKLVSESSREKLIKMALEKYKGEITGKLTSLAKSKGVNVNVTDIDISMN